jgi:alpha-L-rhamnosidase
MFRITSLALGLSATLLVSGGLASTAHAATPPVSSVSASSNARAGISTTLPPIQLRINSQAAGALVAAAKPTLSWAPQDSGRNQTQTAYELRLVGLPTDTGSTTGKTWDSGKIVSSQTTGVTFPGPVLSSDQSYEWSVRTWNSSGQRSGWSSAERFDVGLLAPTDWTTSWISAADGALTRTSFTLPRTVVRARLYVGAQGLAQPSLNGSAVDPTRVDDNSSTDFAKRVAYRAYDVTSELHPGSNVLGVMVGKGSWAGTPTFVAQLSVTYADGSHATFGTDDSWRTSAGPVTGDDFYFGESYDARKEISGWNTSSYDASGWSKTTVVSPVVGPVSLARDKPVTALDTTSCCGWSPAALVDGIEVSSNASEGYHSAIETTSSPKWVQVDLGSAKTLRTVTLFPAHPTNDPAGDNPGVGFPVRYRVLVSDDPTFQNSSAVTTFADRSTADQPNPGLSPVKLTGEATGRYLRIAADVLDCVGASCTFRLAELEAFGAKPAQGFAYTVLEADTTPPSRVTATLSPQTTTVVDGNTVVDFGRNYVGQVTLTAAAPAGTVAAVTKGEILDSAGNVSTSNISFSAADATRQKDAYTFAGHGTETWTPTLDYAGFRYAEVSGLPAGTKVTLTARVSGNDVTQTGSFSTSNPLLNKIQAAVVRTQWNDLQEGMPLDCPTREKRGWMGDAGDSDQEAMANFDMESLYDKWLGDVRTSINPDGSLTSVSPANGQGAAYVTDPAWGSAYPQIVWDSYQQYGDPGVLEDNYVQVKNWVDYLQTISNSDHIVTNSPGSWGDDWLATVSTPHVFYQTGFALLDSRLLAKMANALGKTADAAKYSALAAAIADGFNKTYFDAATDVYGTGTQFSYAMPIALGIVPAGHETAVADKLVADVVAHDDHVTTGFAGTTFVYQALAASGHNDVALQIAERTDGPSFGYMVTQGPGTIWEKWVDSTSPDGTSSKDHIGLGGSIGQWFYQQLAGIQPGSPGWRAFTLAPAIVGDLTHAQATQQTVRGTVSSSWTRSGSDLSYDVTVPVGATATIKLPSTSPLAITESGHPLATVAGVEVVSHSASQVVLRVGSGSYSFEVRGVAEGLAGVMDQATALSKQIVATSTNDIAKPVATSLRASLTSIVTDATAALPLVGTNDAAAAKKTIAALDTAKTVKQVLAGSAVSAAARTALLPAATSLVGSLSSVATSLTGLSVTVSTGTANSFLPGQKVDLAVTLANHGTRAISKLAASAALAANWAVTPPTPTTTLAPGQKEVLHVDATVPASQLPGSVDVPLNVSFDYRGTTITETTPVTLTITSAATVTSVTFDPSTVSPTSTTTAEVVLGNTGTTPVTGHVSITTPTGWATPTDSAEVTVAPGATTTVSVPVQVPMTLAAQALSLPVTFSESGAVLAHSTGTLTGQVATPTDPVDHIDLGDATSEAAHSLVASPTSGTGLEAGLTRRYSGSAPDSFFSFTMAVPVDKPYLITGTETFDGPRIKQYTIKVGATVVQDLSFEHTETAQSSGDYQILVDEPAALSSTGSVTITIQHDPTAQWDPSLADMWTSAVPK